MTESDDVIIYDIMQLREDIVLSVFLNKKGWINYKTIRDKVIPDKDKRKEIRIKIMEEWIPDDIEPDKHEVVERDKYDKPVFEFYGYLENEKALKRTLESLNARDIIEQEGTGANTSFQLNEDYGFRLVKIKHRSIIGSCPSTDMRLWSRNITSYGFTLHGYEGDKNIKEEYTSIETDLETTCNRIQELWKKISQKDVETMGLIKLVDEPRILMVLDVPIQVEQFQKMKDLIVSHTGVSSS